MILQLGVDYKRWQFAGADPGEPSGRGDAAQIAHFQAENGRVAYLSGAAVRLGSRERRRLLPPPLPKTSGGLTFMFTVEPFCNSRETTGEGGRGKRAGTIVTV